MKKKGTFGRGCRPMSSEVKLLIFDYLQYAANGLDKEQVLTDLMEAYGKDVWKYAYFMTLRAEAADDIMQETFLKAYMHLDRFRGGSSVKTWLFSITRHAATIGVPFTAMTPDFRDNFPNRSMPYMKISFKQS